MTIDQKTPLQTQNLLRSRSENALEHGLAPIAYNDTVLPALRLARSSQHAKRIARVLLIMLAVTILVIAVAPWQQAISGSGNVIAFAPLERQQTIQAPIKGRIVRWGEDIYENAYVEAGQEVVEIQDIDPLLLERLNMQLTVTKEQETAVQAQLDAVRTSFRMAQTMVANFEAQLEAYRAVKDQRIDAAEAYVAMAKERVAAEEQLLAEQEAAYEQELADFERHRNLYEDRIVSQYRFQLAERKMKETQAKVARAKAGLRAANQDLRGKMQERDTVEQQAQVAIDGAEAALRQAEGNVARAESDVARSQNDLNRVRNDIVSMESRIAQQESQVVQAPRAGYILRLMAYEGGEIVKEGDPLFVIVPDTKDRAVQIWLLGIDAPLVEPGRHVRLQFEGWPAVQFAGWPSVAVGTFGGRVASVDATDDGHGRFRCLIVPDPEDIEWPSDRFLRQGVRANGWVLLERVPLWFEVWRRLNGFPPAIDMEDGKPVKVPKIPKA